MGDNLTAAAEQHVVRARSIVAEQRTRIERLRAHGCDTLDAEHTLAVFESNLRIFEQHRDWLRERGH